MNPKGYINKRGAAAFLGISKRTVDNLMRRRSVPFYRFGRSILFKEQDLSDAIESCKVNVHKTQNTHPPTAYGTMDPIKSWTFVCQWLRLIENGRDDKHSRLAKDCLAHIAKFVE